MATLDEIDDLHLYDFGIYLELEPDDEEKAMLEQNIQMALQQNQIYLEDAIDIREIKNTLTLANQVLKLQRELKNSKKQDQAGSKKQLYKLKLKLMLKAAEKLLCKKFRKQQALAQTEIQIEQAKSQFEIQRMQTRSLNKNTANG